MRQALLSASDRMLERFLPKARAGACPCFPSDAYDQYRCSGTKFQRRHCTFSCNCTETCGTWVTVHNNC